MGDHTVTLTAIEEKVLESFWPSVEEALQAIIRRQVVVKGKDLVYSSSSIKDPRKMSIEELKTELTAVQDEVPTYTERNPAEKEVEK